MAHIEDIASNRTNRMSVRATATPDAGKKVATFDIEKVTTFDVEKTSTDVADWSYVNVETPVRAFGKELGNVARPQVDESAKEMPHKPKCTPYFFLPLRAILTVQQTTSLPRLAIARSRSLALLSPSARLTLR